MPTITIDGRGLDPKQALQDMWKRAEPLIQKGFDPISEVEIVNTKLKQVVEHFPTTDPEFSVRLQSSAGSSKPKINEEHKPPSYHEYPFLARLTLEG